MDNDQSTPPATDPAATPADSSAPAPTNDATMSGDDVKEAAVEALDNNPAMDMGSGPDAPTNDAPAGDTPGGDAPASDAPSEEPASGDAPTDTPAES